MNKSKILLLSVLFINMKTIEERAANLAKEFATGKQNRETAVYKSCIRMATEQREIDIEEFEFAQQENILNAISKQKQIDIVKACQEFCRNCRIHNDMIGNDCECSQLKDFREALGK